MANLAQLKVLENLDGVLLVDKPAGIAFASVVKAVKRKFNLVKVGHGGSLDAMASGLLAVLIGDANKFAAEVMGADRVWAGSLRFGETTDTGDRYGRP
ncbi:MAG: tRNA pseudouridine(55) synthase TruB, partial [Kiritimatiellae bacterium]|nr:tRNA pseudouridine(55) synthase TruB [Kiritimatiellia bacterium]